MIVPLTCVSCIIQKPKMRLLLIVLYCILLTTTFACKKSTEDSSITDFTYLSFSKDILDFRVTPKVKFDKSGLMFSDQGAWFAFSLIDTINQDIGFSGPFLMTQENGVWLSSKMTSLTVKEKDTKIDFKLKDQSSYSSHLSQSYHSEQIDLKQELYFLSGLTTFIQMELSNKLNEAIELELTWQNDKILADGITLTSVDNLLMISSTNSEATGYLNFPEGAKLSLTNSTEYYSRINIVLAPQASRELVLSMSFIFPEYDWPTEKKKISNNNFDSVLIERKLEKNQILKSLINKRKIKYTTDNYSKVLAKAQLTMQNNWRIPAGEIKYQGLFPSYHYKWFNGFWSWDSWKHAVGLSYYHTELAKDQIKLIYDFQLDNGFIVDCVFRDTMIENHNFRDTKPPLSAWAVAKIYEQDKDLEFISYMYDRLKKYHYWWYEERDHDKDGICEYGSTDGSILAAKWESGMDNAIRFDNAEILQNGLYAFSLNQESVDLNAYLYTEKKYLQQLANALEKKEDSAQFENEAAKLKTIIQSQFYDERDGWFYDTNLEGDKFIKGEGSEGWTALWAKAATAEQAASVKNKMMNTSKFFTKVPFQSMSADHPKFDPLKGYWRGPNWLDQSYFGIKGLRHYGYTEEADKATIQLLKGAEGILEKGKPIRENYHPLTGEGLNANNFSWSAAHIIMLLVKE